MALEAIKPTTSCKVENQELPDFPEDDPFSDKELNAQKVLDNLGFELAATGFDRVKKYGNLEVAVQTLPGNMYRLLLYRAQDAQQSAVGLTPEYTARTGKVLAYVTLVSASEFFHRLHRLIQFARHQTAKPVAESLEPDDQIPTMDPEELLAFPAWETAAHDAGFIEENGGLYRLERPVGEHGERKLEVLVYSKASKGLSYSMSVSYPQYSYAAIVHGTLALKATEDEKSQTARQLAANFKKVHELANGPLRDLPCYKIATHPDVQYSARHGLPTIDWAPVPAKVQKTE